MAKDKSGQGSIAGMILAVLVVLLVFMGGCCTCIVGTEKAGVVTRFGKPTGQVLENGFNFVGPIDGVARVDLRNQTETGKTECYSKDIQQLKMQYAVQFRVKKVNAAEVYIRYGDNYTDQMLPKIDETIKAVIGTFQAGEIVEKRAVMSSKIKESLIIRVADIAEVIDFSMKDIEFSKAYEQAIEEKQVAEQEAKKALNKLEQAKTDAETTITKSTAEAKSIEIVAKAMAENPGIVLLEAVKKWDGKAPATLMLGGDGTAVPTFPMK